MKFGIFVLCALLLFADVVKSCWEVQVISFGNTDRLSDYLTDKDEITMTFGVGKYVAFQYSNFFSENQVHEVPDEKIRFPCFFGEAFYLNILEHDVYEDDTANS